MSSNDGWDKFLKLVPPEKLAAPKPAPRAASLPPEAEELVEVEHLNTARLNEAIRQHSVEMARLSAAQSRPVWEPPAPAQAYLDSVVAMQRWLTYYGTFDAVGERLRTAGLPAFAARLKVVKADRANALVICRDMATANCVHQRALQQKAAEMARDAADEMTKMNAATQKAYDEGNRAWRRNH